MLERDMEDLIASHPDDFFPGREFQLKGRQKSFAGVGRFDLLFLDRFKTNILMELKAVPAKYEDATQLAKYKDELRNHGERHILMWLVAPQLSHSVREFLDRIGIEYSEIHESEFRSVAERHGLSLHSEEPSSIEITKTLVSRRTKNPGSSPRRRKQDSKGVLPVESSREFIQGAIRDLWSKQKNWVTRDQLAEKLGEQQWVTDALNSANIIEAHDRKWCVGNQVDWFSAHYKVGLYGLSDEFERQRISGKWAYRPK